MGIDFFDFKREIAAEGAEILAALEKALRSGRYILGEEGARFEERFAGVCGCRHALGVASGTDALFLVLKAWGVGQGDEVITVANTFAATALAIAYTGATPVFVDIAPDSHLIDPRCIEAAITRKTKAIIPVHLYGQCADMDAIMAIADRHGVAVLEDACQAHGALYRGRQAGGLGHAAAFSFYPTKNLGAYGDAGAITTNDADLDGRLRLLRNYGQTDRYHHVIKGYNSRLDELQAALLNAKLKRFMDWTARRQEVARRYDEHLAGINLIPLRLEEGSTHVYHQYVITVPERDALQEHLKSRGIATLIHYPVPLHRQAAFGDARVVGDLRQTELRAAQILSLPVHPWLKDQEVDQIIGAVLDFVRR
ncbi:MAG TPA: DegT/DnrJ/EryC1/StrS family aminotransferase [Deltaproteobacteria bacterium]|nr:DegT/DnrJ/EryC1/StrS family aminotransferase [Deltaproteobacteria bacterium]